GLPVGGGRGPEALVTLCAQREAPAAVTRLQRLIRGGLDRLAREQRRSRRVVDARGNLQLRDDGDVSIVLCGRPEDPRLCADQHVTQAAGLEDPRGWVDLVARSVKDRNIGKQAPALRQTVLDADAEDVLMIAHCVGARDLLVALK